MLNRIAILMTVFMCSTLHAHQNLPVPPKAPTPPPCPQQCQQPKTKAAAPQTPQMVLAQTLKENSAVRGAVADAKKQTISGQCGAVRIQEMTRQALFKASIACVRHDKSKEIGRNAVEIRVSGLLLNNSAAHPIISKIEFH